MTAEQLMQALDDALEAFKRTKDGARLRRDVANIIYLSRSVRDVA